MAHLDDLGVRIASSASNTQEMITRQDALDSERNMLGTLPSISYHLKFEYHRLRAETDMLRKKRKSSGRNKS
jgi:hypothetical protein